MNLEYLLKQVGLEPKDVVVFRHRPEEQSLDRILPWLAAERPDLFNAYQHTQNDERVEKSLTNATHVASFIRHGPGRALFVGLYSIRGSKRISQKEYWRVPEHVELQKLGMKGNQRPSCELFDMVLTDLHSSLTGRLVIKWPPPELSWWRRAHRNNFEIHAILAESALVAEIAKWNEIVFTWDQLSYVPSSHWEKLSEWRVIYYIYDRSDGKGYVGSAYGKENLLGRWRNYRTSGHGENVLLKKRDPQSFEFSILERVSPDMDQGNITLLESSWKARLHTRWPSGLNKN